MNQPMMKGTQCPSREAVCQGITAADPASQPIPSHASLSSAALCSLRLDSPAEALVLLPLQQQALIWPTQQLQVSTEVPLPQPV